MLNYKYSVFKNHALHICETEQTKNHLNLYDMYYALIQEKATKTETSGKQP